MLVEGKALENLLLDKAFIDLELPLFDEEVLAGFDGTVHFTKQYISQGAALKTPLEKVWGGLSSNLVLLGEKRECYLFD